MGAESSGADERQTTSLESLLARKASPRRRGLQLAAVMVVCAVLVLLVFHQSLTGTLTSTAPSGPPSANRVARIASDTTWGTLLLNGKALAGPPEQTLTLSPGSDTLTLLAPPFAAETCEIVAATSAEGGVPAVTQGPCGVEPLAARADTAGGHAASAQITFLLGGGDLPAAARAAAQEVLSQGLDTLRQRLTVSPGDYFATGLDADGNDISARAAAPLTALLDFTLDPAPRNATCGFPDCGSPFVAPSAGGAPLWSVQIFLRLRWRFYDAAGRPAGEVAYDVPGPVQTYLAYTGGAWRLAQADGSLASVLDVAPADLCIAATDEVGNIGRALLSVRSVRGSLTQGCLIQMQSQSGSAEGLYLWRFGALLAANAQAHRLLPALPIAPPAEVAAVAATQSGSGLGSSR